jgi:hypothetical protein
MSTADRLAELYYRLEQINRTIAALERIEQLRMRRQKRMRRLPPGPVRDVLTRKRRAVSASRAGRRVTR